MNEEKKVALSILFGLFITFYVLYTKNLTEFSLKPKSKKIPILNQNNTTQIKSQPTIANAISLNYFNYSYLINTNKDYCGQDNGKDLLFIAFVPLSPKSFEKRDLIRSTWANKTYLKSKAKVIFLSGKSNESLVNLQIKNESLKYADIVQNDFMDTYYNLTIKTIMGFKWVSSYCQNAKYTLKIDDDVVVNITFLIDYLEGLVKNNKSQNNTLIGNCYTKATVVRNVNSKFYMSKSEFKEDFYGEYCDGPAYILTSDLNLSLYQKSLNTSLIKFEDVYVGVLAKRLSSTFVYINEKYISSNWDITNFEKNSQLHKRLFIYSYDMEHFKKIWNILVKSV